MLSVEQAQTELVRLARVMTDTESCSLSACDGRVLAKGLVSPIAVPGFDNSAMDGYALNLSGLPDMPDQFKVVARIAAGQAGGSLPAGMAARIFTGAPVPDGCDVVVPQEETDSETGPQGDWVRIKSPVRPGQHVRRRGEDIEQGQTILLPGTALLAKHLALAASVGVPTLDVYRSLKVGIFFTGDELVEPGSPLDEGQIYNSNRYAIGSLVRSLGCRLTDYGIVRDSREATLAMLERVSAENDVVITSGGVSVGEEDHVRAAVTQLGTLGVWQVAIKPGKPFAFGRIGQADFIGLPGNPVSAFVTFLLLANPFIKRRQGIEQCLPLRFEAVADFVWQSKGRKREFIRVSEAVDQSLSLRLKLSTPGQGAGVMSSIALADGLVDVPPGASIEPGSRVVYYPMRGFQGDHAEAESAVFCAAARVARYCTGNTGVSGQDGSGPGQCAG
ncbi:molybdopterin molybdenumtransferase MoeA [Orrella marina]|uniref:Molybdopterin molybdenumtransferase n=2 Tax=Orrella marina TaxID=2163011 RepID=A0A2R4XQ17_9BURK|nr:molybdopterin molybdenumtransferase MoeA [Orrella marina]